MPGKGRYVRSRKGRDYPGRRLFRLEGIYISDEDPSPSIIVAKERGVYVECTM